MPLFRLDTPTEVKLATFTARTEHHGEELVSALTLGFALTGPNELLDKLAPSLRPALYTVADDYTPGLEGIEPPTPKLRTNRLTMPLALDVPEIVGGTLYVEWGLDEDMAFGDCRLSKWRLDASDGGTVTLSFKVSTNDIDEEEAGHLFGKQGQAVMIRFEPPKAAPQPSEGSTIDGTQGHPGAGPLFDPEDDADSEGGEPDATDAFVEAHAEPKEWPFPEGDGPNAKSEPKKSRGRKRAEAAA